MLSSGPANSSPQGRVVSLHLHPEKSGDPMQAVDTLDLVSGKGIRGNLRYFGRRSRSTGAPSVRQVTLIEREQILAHAQALGLLEFPPGAVRANIETEGVDLVALLGRRIRVGEALLLFCEARTPCAKMDALCLGLRARMTDNRQGVLAQVIESGRVQIGSPIFAANQSVDSGTEAL